VRSKLLAVACVLVWPVGLALTACEPKGSYEQNRKDIDGVDCVVVRSNQGVAVDCDWGPE
jgi:hypothetical protein